VYCDAIGIFERTQSPRHLNAEIGRVKLGRTLLCQQRFRDALAGCARRGDASTGRDCMGIFSLSGYAQK
jgi:hypothetical protein